MATKNLGKVFMTPKGQWDKTLSYTKLDIVTNKVGKISSGYIATTDIPKNTAISDAKWLKLFDLVDGDVTDEYKALQKDVTNKATNVDTNKKAVDTIYTAIQKLYDVEMDEEVEYTIVGSTEADALNGKISNESPVGAAIIGSKVGETIVVETISGDLEFKILEIARA